MSQMINSIMTALNNIGRGFYDYAAEMFIQSSILIVFLLLIDMLIRKRVRATLKYWIWMLILIKLVLPPSLSLPTGIGCWSGDFIPSNSSVSKKISILDESDIVQAEPVYASQTETTVSTAQINQIESYDINPENTPVKETAAPAQFQSPDLVPLTWQGIVFLIWLVGVSILSVLLIQRIMFVKRLVGQSEPVSGKLNELMNQCRQKVGISRKIELRLITNIQSPAVCGLFRSVILMPACLIERLSPDKLRAVLIHELAHIKRGDLWINCAQTLLQIVYFYNPFFWYANFVIRRIREQAVDEMVLVTLGGQSKSYSDTLIDIAEMAFFKTSLSLRLIGVVESKKALQGRIRHMLARPVPKNAKLGLFGLVVMILAAAVLLPMAKGQSGGIDSFDRNTLIKFNSQSDYLGIVETIGDTKSFSKIYDIRFREGEKLLVVAELYKAGEPMQILGHKVFDSLVDAEKLSGSFSYSKVDRPKTVTTHHGNIKLGEQVFVLPEFKVDKFPSSTRWGWFNGDALRKSTDRLGRDFEAMEVLFYYAGSSSDTNNKAKFWIPASNTTPIEVSYAFVLKAVPLSRLDKLYVEPVGGYQGLNGKLIEPEGFTIQKADIMANEYKQMLLRIVDDAPIKTSTATLPSVVKEELIEVYENMSEGERVSESENENIVSESNPEIPEEFIGHWKGQAKIIVNWTRQKWLSIDIEVMSDGKVTGRVGDSELKDAVFKSNRSWLEKKLNIKTDWMIKGDLIGPIIKNENIKREYINLLFGDLEADRKIKGGFHTSGWHIGNKETMVMSGTAMVLEKNSPDSTSITAVLPDDVTIELLGICEHPSEGRQWWRPDGSLVTGESFSDFDYHNPYYVPEDDEYTRIFAIKLGGRDFDDIKLSWHINSLRSSFYPDYEDEDTKKFKPIQTIIAKFSKDVQFEDLTIRVAVGNWKPVASGGDGRTTSGTNDSITDRSVIFHEADHKDVNLKLSATHLLGSDYDCRIVVYDNQGKLHEPVKRSNSGSDMRLCEGYFDDISPDQINYVGLQARPYERATFKNVSLRPGVKTDVKVEVADYNENPLFQSGQNEQVVGIIKDGDGNIGQITAEHGDAVYGNNIKYTPGLYLGRVRKGDKVQLMYSNVIQNQYDIPIIKIQTINSNIGLPAGTIGWISLKDTSFKDQFIATENISLQPSVKTDVQAEVNQSQNGQDGVISSVSRQRYFVTLVVGRDMMTFEGKKVTWEQLPEMLENIPNRSQTVFCMAIDSEDITIAQLNQKKSKAVNLSRQFGFEYFSYVGVHQLGIRGEPVHSNISGPLKFNEEIKLPLTADDDNNLGLVMCSYIRFDRSDNQVKALLELLISSSPKSKWEVRVRLMNAKAQQLSSDTKIVENSGDTDETVGGPYWSEKKIQFDLGKFSDVRGADSFEIRIRQLPTEFSNMSEDRKSIEHIIQTKLPESVDNCKCARKGEMGWGVSWSYFEISNADLALLLEGCDSLPDTSKLGQDAGSRWNIEYPGEEIDWWKPLELKNRKYAGKEKGTQPMLSRRIDICVGEIKDDLMGVYLVYHVD